MTDKKPCGHAALYRPPQVIVNELTAELNRLRALCRKQQDEIESLRDMADSVEVLRDIGKLIGCGHVEGQDERRQLVNCVEQELYRLRHANAD